jgi:5'-nucleotidase
LSLRILLSNDDGIHAPGLAALERIAATLSDDIWIVAPDAERSGASRSLSLAEPVRVHRLGERRFSLLRGTPTDCVVVALRQLLADRPPDLVLSGVNCGANLGEELTYSGTVAVAMEAAGMGIRAIALSQAFSRPSEVRWQTAEAHAPTVLRALLELPARSGVLHNVNFPDVEAEAVRGVRAVRQGNWARIGIDVHGRTDARGFDYAWLSVSVEAGNAPADTDVGAVAHGFVSVTPVHTDITFVEGLAPLGERLARL